jgi:ATP-dependent DNA helicase RecG
MSARPPILYPLFAEVETLTGVGPKTARALENIGLATPRDLIFSLPVSGIDRAVEVTVSDAALPGYVTVPVAVGRHHKPAQKGRPYRITVDDARTAFQLVFFHGRADYLERLLPTGQKRIISGKAELFDGMVQMPHPDFVVKEGQADEIPRFEPVYTLTAGVTAKVMSKAIAQSLTRLPDLPEWIDPAQRREKSWPDFAQAIHTAHAPCALADLEPKAPARERLAYDELFAHQLTLALARQTQRARAGRATQGTGELRNKVLKALPFKPTVAQLRAIDEISGDLATPMRMNRLLQGDVGAGKTLVALLALLAAVEAGGQGVLMAPTEILARQHMESLAPLLKDLSVRLAIMTGRDKAGERAQKRAALEAGEIDILLGTHAVFQSEVEFKDLRLAVIDEQHRFGVRQRMLLGEKGAAVDVLVMTATPIPRSLALTQYGDMDVSVLDEKPPGRKPIKTAMISTERLEDVVARLSAAIEAGRQCYWVCPLVEESEVLDLTAAEQRFKVLRAALGDAHVGLVHGQMAPEDKDAAMQCFQENKTKVLVATTVIEVGVNVPNATIMVVERAETFGLAQLHQLRGRVGRGAAESTCLLLYQAPLSHSARKRLELLRESEDGFRIAQLDLEMRGAGDVIGTAQSGLPRFQVADLERQPSLMQIAQSDARTLLTQDPQLTSERGQAARNLLWLMRQDEAIRLLSVG